MFLSTAQLKRSRADLTRQLALFNKSARQLQRELRHLKQTDVFENLARFLSAVNTRHEAFSSLMEKNAVIPADVSEADRTKSLFENPATQGGSAPYDFLESEKVITRAIEEFDEKRVLLGRAASYSDVKNAEDAGDKALAKKLEENSWLFAAAHHSVESLCRQAESIISSQWAILHGQGLHFWQGRQKWFRYAGDARDSVFDCPAT